MDEIKQMPNVVDVWSPKDQRIDIIVETDAETTEQVEALENQIKILDGVYQIIPDISIEIMKK